MALLDRIQLMKKSIIAPLVVLMSLTQAIAAEKDTPKSKEELRIMLRNECFGLATMVEQTSIKAQLENTDTLIKAVIKPELLSGIHGKSISVNKDKLIYNEPHAPELRNIVIYAGATDATQEKISEEQAQEKIKEANKKLEVYYKDLRKMFKAASDANVKIEHIIPASDSGFLSGLHFDNYQLKLPNRLYLNIDPLIVFGQFIEDGLHYEVKNLDLDSFDLNITANIKNIEAENARLLSCKNAECLEEDEFSKLKIKISDYRGRIPLDAKFKIYWNQDSAQVKLVSAKLNTLNLSYTFSHEYLDEDLREKYKNVDISLPNLSTKLVDAMASSLAQGIANRLNSALVNNKFASSVSILSKIKKSNEVFFMDIPQTEKEKENSRPYNYIQQQYARRADACAIKGEELNFSLKDYLEENKKSSALYFERQMQSNQQVIDLINKKSQNGPKLDWEVLETMTIKDLNTIITDPTVGNVVIVAHAAQNGSLMDSNFIEVPERVFANISPTIRSISVYSCHDGLVRKKYKLEEKLKTQNSIYENRMALFPITMNFMNTPESAPIMAVGGFLQKVELMLDTKITNYSSNRTQDNKQTLCSAYLVNEDSENDLNNQSRLKLQYRKETQFQVTKGSYMFSLNGKPVGVLEPKNHARLEFSCDLLKPEGNVIINQDITTELNSTIVEKKFNLHLNMPGQGIRIIPGEHFQRKDNSYRSSKFKFDL